ncbi:MAG: glycosyltransferase family 2 protein [Gallintestinimicrobium sp.]
MTETTTLSPLVSIIVPVYNVERYIKRCVDSLQGQTLQNIEIILVDDGSKDNSGRLCDEFAQQDPRIHVIHKQNAGQGLARNDGLNIAKGRYVLFIDSDDFIEPDTCEMLSDRMEREQADLCSFGYQIETLAGELFYRAQLKNSATKTKRSESAL